MSLVIRVEKRVTTHEIVRNVRTANRVVSLTRIDDLVRDLDRSQVQGHDPEKEVDTNLLSQSHSAKGLTRGKAIENGGITSDQSQHMIRMNLRSNQHFAHQQRHLWMTRASSTADQPALLHLTMTRCGQDQLPLHRLHHTRPLQLRSLALRFLSSNRETSRPSRTSPRPPRRLISENQSMTNKDQPILG